MLNLLAPKPKPPKPTVLPRYPHQQEALRVYSQGRVRLFCLLWERQGGKSTALADLSLHEMMAHRRRTCVYASASLLLGRELVLKQRQRLDLQLSCDQHFEKEAAALQRATAGYDALARKAGMSFQLADSRRDKVLGAVRPGLFAQLFQDQRLEFRVYHDQTSYSRTKIIAPNVATARSWSGTVFLDEVAFIEDFGDLMVGVAPIISSNPDFKLIMSTTPPECDDQHYSYSLLAPPPGLQFAPNHAGNWYESSEGHVQVHRADAYDTHLGGKRIFDVHSGTELTPEQALNRAPNRRGFMVSHLLAWLPGGMSACDLLRLRSAQERGIAAPCRFFMIENGKAGDALEWLAQHLDPAAPVGLGLDLATTSRKTSNPSVLAIAESQPGDTVIRAILAWKTDYPQVTVELLERVLRVVANRRPGGRPKALAVDASNEKYFCRDLEERFGQFVPVYQVVANERYQGPNLLKPCDYKEYLGDQYIALLQDNRLTLPPEEYVRLDHRLVVRDRGRFVCEPDAEGRHGDTFDACKLAVHALKHEQPFFSSTTIW